MKNIVKLPEWFDLKNNKKAIVPVLVIYVIGFAIGSILGYWNSFNIQCQNQPKQISLYNESGKVVGSIEEIPPKKN